MTRTTLVVTASGVPLLTSHSPVGTASGLFRVLPYTGSMASPAVAGIVFRTSATDDGLHVIAVILVALGVGRQGLEP